MLVHGPVLLQPSWPSCLSSADVFTCTATGVYIGRLALYRSTCLISLSPRRTPSHTDQARCPVTPRKFIPSPLESSPVRERWFLHFDMKIFPTSNSLLFSLPRLCSDSGTRSFLEVVREAADVLSLCLCLCLSKNASLVTFMSHSLTVGGLSRTTCHAINALLSLCRIASCNDVQSDMEDLSGQSRHDQAAALPMARLPANRCIVADVRLGRRWILPLRMPC
jgi:hypothetical protein